VQCIIIRLICGFATAGGWYLLPRLLEIACIDLPQTGSVGAGSTCSWLCNFGGPAPREGGLRQGKNFGSALLQPASSVCVSLSTFIIAVVTRISTNCSMEVILELSVTEREFSQFCVNFVQSAFFIFQYCWNWEMKMEVW